MAQGGLPPHEKASLLTSRECSWACEVGGFKNPAGRELCGMEASTRLGRKAMFGSQLAPSVRARVAHSRAQRPVALPGDCLTEFTISLSPVASKTASASSNRLRQISAQPASDDGRRPLTKALPRVERAVSVEGCGVKALSKAPVKNCNDFSISHLVMNDLSKTPVMTSISLKSSVKKVEPIVKAKASETVHQVGSQNELWNTESVDKERRSSRWDPLPVCQSPAP